MVFSGIDIQWNPSIKATVGNERLAFIERGVLISGIDLYSKGYFGTLQRGLYRGSVLTSEVVVKRGSTVTVAVPA